MLETQEMWVQSLGWEDPLEEKLATYFSILAWKIHGQRRLVGYSPELQRVRHDGAHNPRVETSLFFRFAKVCKGWSEHFGEFLIRLENLGMCQLVLSEMRAEETAWGTI